MNLLRHYVAIKKPHDWYFLDDENAILIFKNADDTTYTCKHLRLVGNKIKVMNRWNIDFYFSKSHSSVLIPELNLFKIQNNRGQIGALYDYIRGEFVVQEGIWDEIIEVHKDVDFTAKYKGFVAQITIRSDYIDEENASFISPITGESIPRFFFVQEDYYAILNFDGTIRCNTLFEGDDLGRVRKVIDLNWYGSLEAFKKAKKNEFNKERDERIREYKRQLAKTGKVSSYEDDEVLKVLEFMPKEDPKH